MLTRAPGVGAMVLPREASFHLWPVPGDMAPAHAGANAPDRVTARWFPGPPPGRARNAVDGAWEHTSEPFGGDVLGDLQEGAHGRAGAALGGVAVRLAPVERRSGDVEVGPPHALRHELTEEHMRRSACRPSARR